MSLPKTTTKQQEILKLLYRHRYLERKQIQGYLEHTNKSRTIRWLKDLKEKQFIDWIYDPIDPNERSKPAIYFLDTNGIRYLRGLDCFPETELRKRYKDGTRKQDFINRSLLLANCSLHLEARNKEDPDTLHYDYALEVDYVDPDNDFYFLSESEYIRPDITYTKHIETNEEFINQTYFMQLFGLSTPRYIVKKQLKGYIEYLEAGEWEDYHGDENLPIVLITCPSLAELIYAKRYVRKQLFDRYYDDVPDEIILRFSTIEKLRSKGLTAVIWEDH